MAQVKAGSGDRDEGLAFFTREEADDFRDLVIAEWARHGITMVVGPGKGHLVSTGGEQREAGLWNLGADCLRERRSRWPEIIARHVQLGLVDPLEMFINLSPSAIRRSVYRRLAAADSIPEGWCAYAREVAPGLVEVLNIYRHHAAALVSDRYLDRLGGLEKLRTWGEDNLRTLAVKASGCAVLGSPEGGIFRVLRDESMFTASRILTPERLVQQLFGCADMPHGVVVALPNRHEVAAHLVEDDSLVPSMADLAKYARLAYRDAPGPLSVNVYWVTGDRFEQVIGTDGRGGAVPTWSPEFSWVAGKAMRTPAAWRVGLPPAGPQPGRRSGPRRSGGERGAAM